MIKLKNYTGKTASIPTGIALGTSISIMITLGVSIIIAKGLNSEDITWNQAGYWIMGMLFISAFIGSKSAVTVIKRQKVMVSIMTGSMYWSILLCITALFFGGSYDAIWETGGLICAGSSTSILLSRPVSQKVRQKSKRSIVKLNKFHAQ